MLQFTFVIIIMLQNITNLYFSCCKMASVKMGCYFDSIDKERVKTSFVTMVRKIELNPSSYGDEKEATVEHF